MWFDHRVGRFVRSRARTNDRVNEEWHCDRGAFGHDFYNDPQRLDRVFVRTGNNLVESEWGAAYAQILARFAEAGDSAAFLLGHELSNESIHLISRFAEEHVGTANVDFRYERHLPGADVPHDTIPLPDLEAAKSLLVFGTSLADEEPIVFLRTRKAWFRDGARVVVAHSEPTDADSFAHLLLRYEPGTEAHLATGLLAAMVRGGHATVDGATRERLWAYSAEETERVTGVRAADLEEAAGLLAGAPVLASRGLYDAPTGAEAAGTLSLLAAAAQSRFFLMSRFANEEGAHRILGPSKGKSTHDILRGCVDGSVKSLWISGLDLLDAYPDRALAEAALESVEFLVVQDLRRTGTTDYASVVLPMTAPAEQDGTYTNVSGLIQPLHKIIDPLGSAKPVWRTMTELTLRLKPQRPFIQARDVYEDLASRNPSFV